MACSEQLRKKRSEAAKKRWADPVFKEMVIAKMRKRVSIPCQCGCGEMTAPGKRFMPGHNSRIDHPMKGKKHSPEAIRKMKESHNDWQRGEKHPMYGKAHTSETRKKMSESHKGVPLTEEHRTAIGIASIRVWASKSKEDRRKWAKNISIGETGKIVSEETRRKNSEANKGKRRSPPTEFKKGTTPYMKGKHHKDESIIKNREANRKLWTDEKRKKTSQRMKGLWTSPQHAKKCLSFNSPNKQEFKLMAILDSMYPGEWKFVGDGQVVIAGKCPDFINVNGQKKIIELFGERWHEKDEVATREKLFVTFGYSTLVIWSKELKKIGTLRAKLADFCEAN